MLQFLTDLFRFLYCRAGRGTSGEEKMTQYLIMCPSLTAAQRSQKLLERSGISAALVKAPQGLNTLGCGYSLSLYKGFSEAVNILRKNSMLKGKLFEREQNGEYIEVKV